MTNVTEKDIHYLKEKIDSVDEKVNILGTKIDGYLNLFQLKDDAQREHNRLENMIKEKADREDVQEIKNTFTWVTRLVVGAVIMALMGLVIYNANV